MKVKVKNKQQISFTKEQIELLHDVLNYALCPDLEPNPIYTEAEKWFISQLRDTVFDVNHLTMSTMKSNTHEFEY